MAREMTQRQLHNESSEIVRRQTSCLNQVSHRMCDERFTAPHSNINLGECVAILLDGEIRYPPDTFTEYPHHSAHVVELRAALGGASVGDDQTGGVRCGAFAQRVSPLPFVGKRPTEVLDQLERRCRCDVLREVAATWGEDTVYLLPVLPHWVARRQLARAFDVEGSQTYVHLVIGCPHPWDTDTDTNKDTDADICTFVGPEGQRLGEGWSETRARLIRSSRCSLPSMVRGSCRCPVICN